LDFPDRSDNIFEVLVGVRYDLFGTLMAFNKLDSNYVPVTHPLVIAPSSSSHDDEAHDTYYHHHHHIAEDEHKDERPADVGMKERQGDEQVAARHLTDTEEGNSKNKEAILDLAEIQNDVVVIIDLQEKNQVEETERYGHHLRAQLSPRGHFRRRDHGTSPTVIIQS
jgi:hypothetical protein